MFLRFAFALAAGTALTAAGCSAAHSDDYQIRAVAEDFLDADDTASLAATLTGGAAQNANVLMQILHSQPDKAESWHTQQVGDPVLIDQYWAKVPVMLDNRAESDSRYVNILARRVGDGWRVWGIEFLSSPEDKTTINFEDSFSLMQFGLVLLMARAFNDAAKSFQPENVPR